jgi:hypothetical protein
VSSTLHEFYAAQGTALAGEARGPRRDHDPPAAGPSRLQVQRSPSSSQGPEQPRSELQWWESPHPAVCSNSRHHQAPPPAASPGAHVR